MPPLKELNMTTAGPLRSTGVTPLPRYYGPLRLPTDQRTGLCIPLPPLGYEPQPAGSLRFLDLSFATRHPLPPRWADPLHLLVASRDVLASSYLTDWPPITCVSRLNPVQPYGLRLTASLSSGPPPSPGVFHPDRSRFPCFVTSARQTAAAYLTSNYMATSFQIAGKVRLNLTHQKTLNNSGWATSIYNATLSFWPEASDGLKYLSAKDGRVETKVTPWSPSSNAACSFPALRFPVAFTTMLSQ